MTFHKITDHWPHYLAALSAALVAANSEMGWLDAGQMKTLLAVGAVIVAFFLKSPIRAEPAEGLGALPKLALAFLLLFTSVAPAAEPRTVHTALLPWRDFQEKVQQKILDALQNPRSDPVMAQILNEQQKQTALIAQLAAKPGATPLTDPTVVHLLNQLAANHAQLMGALQKLPIAGPNLQPLPVAGQNLQPLPVAGSVHQILDVTGQPKYILHVPGQPLQVLPVAPAQPGPTTPLAPAQPAPLSPSAPLLPVAPSVPLGPKPTPDKNSPLPVAPITMGRATRSHTALWPVR
jgi:hypothetical protein